jgi:arylsulfatase A-like enzyme
MNALAKLLDAGNYRRIISRDHITEELFGLGGDTSVLDRRTDEMMHTFCGTIAELTHDLDAHADDPRPVFAHTRPLDLHIGNTRFATVPTGESYPGFFAPYAARVRRIDACFGELVDHLKATGRYDNSIIIVMADHGDSLGEGLRWGHGYTIVPEVLRIPLLIRVPLSLRQRFTTDVTRVSFATDVTPSLYALLGIPPERQREAEGISLFSGRGTEPSSRRHEAYLVASSYGAVYGVIRHNGRRLYIADAIEGRDSAYDLAPASGDTRLGMTDAERQADRALIRAQIDDVARWYGYPQP